MGYGYCDSGFRVKSFSLCNENYERLNELKELFKQYGKASDGFIINLAIQTLHTLLDTGNTRVVLERSKNPIVVHNPVININQLKATAMSSVDIEVNINEIVAFLEKLVNPPSYLGKPYPWIQNEARQLLSKIQNSN